MNGRVLNIARVAFAGLVVVAIIVQIATVAAATEINFVNFFSYFTIQSNLIGVAVLLAAAAAGSRPRSAGLDWWRGAASVYLTVTFVVVILLLSNVDVGLQLPWVDFVLHKLFPVVVVADYILDPPQNRLAIRDGLLWLAYPLIWLVYTLIRGPIADWYPYPFLDPANGGYGSVAVTSIIILVAGAVLCWVFVAIANMRGDGRLTSGPA